MMLKTWLRELRAPFFTATIAPVAFGAAYARFEGNPFDWPRFALTMLGALFVHAGLNMANDYFDHRSGNDDLTVATSVSGGSKVIQEGLLSPRAVLAASVGCLAAGAATGIWLDLITPGHGIIFLGVVGMIFAWFYGAPPLRLGHRGGPGELACVLGFGPVMGLGAYWVQAGRMSWPAFAATLPIGLLMGLVLFINEFHDFDADRRVGKRTLVVALGPALAARVFVGLLGMTPLLTAALVALKVLPAVSLLSLATLPVFWYVARRTLATYANPRLLLPANLALIALHLVFSAILTATTLA